MDLSIFASDLFRVIENKANCESLCMFSSVFRLGKTFWQYVRSQRNILPSYLAVQSRRHLSAALCLVIKLVSVSFVFVSFV